MSSSSSTDDCLLCDAEQVTEWFHDDEECWVAECMVCRTPMIVWRTHGLPEAEVEATLLSHLERIATERYGNGRLLDRSGASADPGPLARARATGR